MVSGGSTGSRTLRSRRTAPTRFPGGSHRRRPPPDPSAAGEPARATIRSGRRMANGSTSSWAPTAGRGRRQHLARSGCRRLPERLTDQHAAVNFLAPIEPAHRALRRPGGGRSRARGCGPSTSSSESVPAGVLGTGPLCVGRLEPGWPPPRRHRRQPNAVPLASPARRPVSGRAGGRAVFAAGADRSGLERPRFGGTSLYFLSSRGAGDGLWRVEDGGRRLSGATWMPPCPSRRQSRGTAAWWRSWSGGKASAT